jgi:hypothetical protein
LFFFLTSELGHARVAVATTIWHDYQRCGRSDRPGFLVGIIELPVEKRTARGSAPRRQARHIEG